MLLSIFHVLLFAVRIIQAAPQNIQISSQPKQDLRCYLELLWENERLEVGGFAWQGKDICKGFVLTGKWNNPSKNIPASSLRHPYIDKDNHIDNKGDPQCCISLHCGGVEGVTPGFCTEKGKCPLPGHESVGFVFCYRYDASIADMNHQKRSKIMS